MRAQDSGCMAVAFPGMKALLRRAQDLVNVLRGVSSLDIKDKTATTGQ